MSATVSPHGSSERVEVERLRRSKLIGEDLISNLDRVVSLVVGRGTRGEGGEDRKRTVRTARDTRLYEE